MSTLVQRSVLDASGFPLDQIQILGIAARGFHGVLESEREAGQDFSADVTLYLDTRAAARDDDLDETVNYALVAQDVVDILSGEPVDLIETVAEQIAAAVLDRPLVASVDVTVHKPQAPIPVPFSDVTVTINRDRLNVPVVSSPVAPALDELPAEDLAESWTDQPLPAEDLRDADVHASQEAPATALSGAGLPAVSFPAAGLAGEPVASDGIPVAGSAAVPPATLPADLPEAFEPVAVRVDESENDVETPTPSSSPTLDLPLGQLTAPVAARESDPASYSTSELHLESDLVHDEPDASLEPQTHAEPQAHADPQAHAEPETHAEPESDAGPSSSAGPDADVEPEEGDAADDVVLPEGSDQTAAPVALVPPVDESLLAEQARLSEQARRPEVFGLRPRTDAHLRPSTDDAEPVDDHEQREQAAAEAAPSETRGGAPEAVEPEPTEPDPAETDPTAPDPTESGANDPEAVERRDVAPGPAVPATAVPATVAQSTAGEEEAAEGTDPHDAAARGADSTSGGPQMGAAFFAAASAAVLNASRDRAPLSFEELLNPSAAGDQPSAPAAAPVPSASSRESHPTGTSLPVAGAVEGASETSGTVADGGAAAAPEAGHGQGQQTPTPAEEPAEDLPADQPHALETTTEAQATPALLAPDADETPDADQTQLVEPRPEPEPVLGADALDDAPVREEQLDGVLHDGKLHDGVLQDGEQHDDKLDDHAVSEDALTAGDTAHVEPEPEPSAEPESADPGETAVFAVPESGLRPDVVEDLDAPTSPVPVTDAPGAGEAPVSTPASGSAAVASAPASPAIGAPVLAGGAQRRGETPLQLDRMDARPDEPVDAVLALGANLGDAQGTLRRAVAELDTLTGVDVVEVGPLARTAAVGGPEQPDFLNTVVIVRTTLSPRELLHGCQSVEAGNGRERDVRWGPRTLDIDIVVFGDVIGSATDLELPHPRANERAFVLAPWAHLAPEAHLPGLGGGPVAALAATAHDREGIRWLALDWLHDAELPTAAQTSRPAAVAPALTAVQVVSMPDGEPSEGVVPTTPASVGTTEHAAAPVPGDHQAAVLPEAAEVADPEAVRHETAYPGDEAAHDESTLGAPERGDPERGETTPLDSPERADLADEAGGTVDGAPAAEDRPL